MEAKKEKSASPSSPHGAKILLLAAHQELIDLISRWFKEIEIVMIGSEKEFEDYLEMIQDGVFCFTVCSEALGSSFSLEVGQVLNSQIPSTPNFYVAYDRQNFDKKTIRKNGFTEAFLLPLDQEMLKEKLFYHADTDALRKKHYKSIRVMDLDANSKLGFDTFICLPLNKKYIRYSSADRDFGQDRFNKLKTKDVGSLFIDQKDTDKFYEYSAQQLHKLGQSNSAMSETEREEKLRSAVSDFFHELFDYSSLSDFDQGKEIMNQCHKIVSQYVTGGSTSNWQSRLLSSLGGKVGPYERATGTSTIAALFAIGLGHKNPEDLALAGFFHDVALADFPFDMSVTPESELSEDQLKKYKEHPQNSINILKSKRLVIGPSVEKAILQHHERFDGKGFPKGLNGDRIAYEAQLLSLAGQFWELTAHVEGKKRLTPQEAIEVISQNGTVGRTISNPVKKLLTKG